MPTLLLLAAEAVTESVTGLPWAVVAAVTTAITTVIAVLWKTSESRTAKLLDLQERTLTALANNSAALESLRDALEK